MNYTSNRPNRTLNATEDTFHPSRDRRKKGFKSATLYYQNATISTKAVVRDDSLFGVRLEICDQDATVPNFFTLEVPMDGYQVDCEVRWREENIMGVVFVGERVASRRSSPKLTQDLGLVYGRSGSILRKRNTEQDHSN